MTSPTLTELNDKRKLYWQQQDEATQQRYQQQQIKDVISPQVGQLSDQMYSDRINDIRVNSQLLTQQDIAASQSKNAYDQQIRAQKMQREWEAAMAQAQQASNAWAMGNPMFGAVNYAGGFGGGNPNSAGWGSGGAQGVANALRAAGFPESEIATGVAIAMGESSWNPNATHMNSNGTVDQGLFQINSVHKGNSWYPQNPFDPMQSARAAYALWQGRGGKWTDWVVYNTGKYKQYLQQAPPIQPANIAPYAANTGSATGLRAAIVSDAQRYIGLPYIWGGTNLSRGVDCSGLVYAIYNQMGIPLPRLTAQGYATQFPNGGVGGIKGVRTSVAYLQPGDLVAWNGGYDRGVQIGHIAIYAGNGEVIEATGNAVRRSRLYNNDNAFGVHLYI